MAKVHFAPYSAIRYVGSKTKELSTSLARPKPMLKRGDIIIVDKKSAHNFVNKGFGEFEFVENIEFLKKDIEANDTLEQTQERLSAFENENNSLFAKLLDSSTENEKLKVELAEALKLLAADENLDKPEENLDIPKGSLSEQKEQGN